MEDFAKTFAVVVSLIVAGTPAAAWLIHLWSGKQTEIEKLKAGNTKSALSRLEDDVKDFRSAINSIQTTVKDLNMSLIQNRADVGVLKERLDDTKKLFERYEKSHDEKLRNIIKTEIVELSKQAALIRAKKIT